MKRCEGWIRTGGIFTLGPVEWDQCKNDGKFMVTFKYQDEPEKTLPACESCLSQIEGSGAVIIRSTIITA